MDVEEAMCKFEIYYEHEYQVEKLATQYFDVVYDMLTKYQDKFNYYQIYSKDDFKHYFTNTDFVHSYVVLDKSGEVLDFYSFYTLPYVEAKTNKRVNAAVLHLYTSTNVTQLTIINSLILSAQELDCDVLTLTNIMENNDIICDNLSRFIKDTSHTYYNLYNVRCPDLFPEQICGFV